MKKVKITNEAGENAKLWVYDDIGGFFGGITANDVRLALADVGNSKPIDVHVNSGGGDYFEGVAIHSLLTRRKGLTTVYVDGLAASAASIIAMAGSTIEMAAGSQMMIHEVRAGFYGTAGEFRHIANTMDTSNEDIIRIYSKRWTGTTDELRQALADETWLSADDAIKMGLADSTGKQLALAASIDPGKYGYKHVPTTLRNDFSTLNSRVDKLRLLEESRSKKKESSDAYKV